MTFVEIARSRTKTAAIKLARRIEKEFEALVEVRVKLAFPLPGHTYMIYVHPRDERRVTRALDAVRHAYARSEPIDPKWGRFGWPSGWH